VPWSENCAFHGVDPDNLISFYHHLGRVAAAPEQWRGDFALCLPDGRLLLQTTYGNSETATRMGDGTLQVQCIEPLRTWRVTFDGIAYLSDRDANAEVFLSVELEPVPVSFDIRWEGIGPMYRAPSGSPTDFSATARQHYEQGGVFRGRARIDGRDIALNGTSFRDHSVGHRDYARCDGHTWVSAAFPGINRSFAVLNVHDAPAPKTSFLWNDDTLQAAEMVEIPEWEPGQDDFEPGPVKVVLRAAGREVVIAGEPIGSGFYWTMFSPSQLCFGRDPSRMRSEHHLVCKEIPYRWRWDDDEAVGMLEVSGRLGI
jgi:hypothetical protein